MFDSPRYLTWRVHQEIPPELVLLMWNLIDELKKRESEEFQVDYLQVFQLQKTFGELNQKLEHWQEVPEFHKKYFFNVEKPVQAKIYVIDSVSDILGESYSTMLLAEEY